MLESNSLLRQGGKRSRAAVMPTPKDKNNTSFWSFRLGIVLWASNLFLSNIRCYGPTGDKYKRILSQRTGIRNADMRLATWNIRTHYPLYPWNIRTLLALFKYVGQVKVCSKKVTHNLYCSYNSREAVSYTHLDVYKRQVWLWSVHSTRTFRTRGYHGYYLDAPVPSTSR